MRNAQRRSWRPPRLQEAVRALLPLPAPPLVPSHCFAPAEPAISSFSSSWAPLPAPCRLPALLVLHRLPPFPSSAPCNGSCPWRRISPALAAAAPALLLPVASGFPSACCGRDWICLQLHNFWPPGSSSTSWAGYFTKVPAFRPEFHHLRHRFAWVQSRCLHSPVGACNALNSLASPLPPAPTRWRCPYYSRLQRVPPATPVTCTGSGFCCLNTMVTLPGGGPQSLPSASPRPRVPPATGTCTWWRGNAQDLPRRRAASFNSIYPHSRPAPR